MDIPNIQPPSQTPQAQINLDVPSNAVQQQVVNRLPIGATRVGQIIGNDKTGNIIVRLAGSALILAGQLAPD